MFATDQLTRLTGFGSVHDVPKLPEGFNEVFESHEIVANGVKLHAVIGGKGRPLLLLAGWPQNWYAWRYLMMPLARNFTVIAVDPRGVGLSEMALNGYDSDTLAQTLRRCAPALIITAPSTNQFPNTANASVRA
jgi:hypothetical protein